MPKNFPFLIILTLATISFSYSEKDKSSKHNIEKIIKNIEDSFNLNIESISIKKSGNGFSIESIKISGGETLSFEEIDEVENSTLKEARIKEPGV